MVKKKKAEESLKRERLRERVRRRRPAGDEERGKKSQRRQSSKALALSVCCASISLLPRFDTKNTMFLPIMGEREPEEQQEGGDGPSLFCDSLKPHNHRSFPSSLQTPPLPGVSQTRERVGIPSRPCCLPLTLFAKTIPEAETIFSSAYDADRTLLVEPTAMIAVRRR